MGTRGKRGADIGIGIVPGSTSNIDSLAIALYGDLRYGKWEVAIEIAIPTWPTSPRGYISELILAILGCTLLNSGMNVSVLAGLWQDFGGKG